MDEELTEVRKLRWKLQEAMRVLARHVDTHFETKLAPEYLALVMKCEQLERQLNQLDDSTAGSTKTRNK